MTDPNDPTRLESHGGDGDASPPDLGIDDHSSPSPCGRDWRSVAQRMLLRNIFLLWVGGAFVSWRMQTQPAHWKHRDA